MAAVGGGFLIGHVALAIMTPLAFLALGVSYRAHRQPLALAFGAVALAGAYVHVFGGTPEWTLYGVLAASLLAAVLDWRATRMRPLHMAAARLNQVRIQ